MRDTIFHILFVWYPYVCLSAFIFGSIIRFDREQYTWKASSSQMLRKKQLSLGSNLFHIGILFLLMGHTVGLLTPTALYTLVITPEQKQFIAIVAGGVAGVVCFVGLSLLLHRRLFDARIRQTSTYMDLGVLAILWVQLVLGLMTLPYSFSHHDASVMLVLSHWAQGILTVQPVDAQTLQGLNWPYLVHLVLGMTIFLIFPFSRLVHIWSAPVWYLGRKGYQVVRTRRVLTAGPSARSLNQPAE
ncbi:MAG TPA: respiratory nitrate reductase subunit gamma [Bosea sp. (in: a-proteobacteria)]|jgi:nitrate reductase gamma subunit|uniref:respiratory nitrate reductase subunit gamma n=1 Tax=Bosea sp. (in: a-proteobacteria) TaxID=1871050 RepID=UPI002DDD402C|nr:respiratory nitrate reductase subunit gamma [Bosea sp. (in: a-proteobacteria)]HEV2556949.1 respiratory nitrate reductase subunit gamma [Bosea sp. (in: a-proteobacteria)]